MADDAFVEFPGDGEVVFFGGAGADDEFADGFGGDPLDGLGDTHVLEFRVVEETEFNSVADLLADFKHRDVLLFDREIVEINFRVDLFDHVSITLFLETVVGVPESVREMGESQTHFYF